MTSDYKALDNFSLSEEESNRCRNYTPEISSFDTDILCPEFHDGVSCWPLTKAGTVAVIPCFPELNTIQYDASENATRLCFSNGSWASSSNYSNCKVINFDYSDVLGNKWRVTEITVIVYYIGFCISLVAVGIAFFIFSYFKELRCLRNTIHAHLMLTYILVAFSWIVAASSHRFMSNKDSGTCIMIVILHYFKGTNFFWMFVEGFYLKMLVVKTFAVENIKFKIYVLIGWGIPAVIVSTWAVVKALVISSANNLNATMTDEDAQLSVGCPWLIYHKYDWIFITPVLLVLLINVYFLVEIMWVLITKLRAISPQESRHYNEVIPYGDCLCFYRQHTSVSFSHDTHAYKIQCSDFILWKATKALLVLIPLLGITYILVITSPKSGISAAIFAYIRSVLISTQGVTVATLYCFLNGEVQMTIRNHWWRWRDKRSFRCHSKRSSKICGRNIDEKNNLQPLFDVNHSDRKDGAFNHLNRTSVVSNGSLTAQSIISPPYIYVTKDSVLWEISV